MSDIPADRPKGKVVRLSVIKTNGQRRRRKQLAEEIAGLREVVHDNDVVGYVVVMWTRDNRELAFWDTECLGAASPLRGDLAKRAIERVSAQRDIAALAAEEDEDL